MTIIFHNITIAMEAASARAAYDTLCTLLDRYNSKASLRRGGGIEWDTDTYSVDGGQERSTEELFPN